MLCNFFNPTFNFPGFHIWACQANGSSFMLTTPHTPTCTHHQFLIQVTSSRKSDLNRGRNGPVFQKQGQLSSIHCRLLCQTAYLASWLECGISILKPVDQTLTSAQAKTLLFYCNFYLLPKFLLLIQTHSELCFLLILSSLHTYNQPSSLADSLLISPKSTFDSLPTPLCYLYSHCSYKWSIEYGLQSASEVHRSSRRAQNGSKKFKFSGGSIA